MRMGIGARTCAMLIATVVLAVPQAAKAAADGSALSAGIVVEGKLAGGQSHSYPLPLTTGQSANLVIEQKGIDCVVRIRTHTP
jgi:hypothetical protein